MAKYDSPKTKAEAVQPAGRAFEGTLALILDADRPIEERAQLFLNMVWEGENSEDPDKLALVTALLDSKSAETSDMREKKKAISQLMRDLEAGPVIAGTYVGKLDPNNPNSRRLEVVSGDGQLRYPVCSPNIKLEDLKPGFAVWMDVHGVVVLGALDKLPYVGPHASFLRQLDDDRMEVMIDEHRLTVSSSYILKEALANNELKRGDQLLVCPKREVGFRAIPVETDKTYRFVDTSQIPDIDIARDIGSPHWVLDYLITRTRVLLFHPDFMQQFEMRPRVSALLSGPSGTGKTLTIKGFLRQFQNMMIEKTGLADIPTRVVRAKTSELLSEWFGRTDKNIDEFFDDVHDLVSKPVVDNDGKEIILPVVLVLEEAEGFGRRRGADHDGVYDRIIGTFLQRLDDPTQDLSRFPLIIISTSNRPDLFDAAVWRRLSGVVADFKRLDAKSFRAVLEKKLKPNFPYDVENAGKGSARDAILQRMTAHFYPSGEEIGDDPVLQLTTQDGKKIDRYVRHFMTGAIIEQSVTNVIDSLAVRYSKSRGRKELAISEDLMRDGIRQYIASIVKNLSPYNVNDYMDIPDGAKVSAVRSLV